MIYYKSNEEIELIRNSSLLVSKTLAEVAKHIKMGMTTLELDKIAEEFILSNHAVPAFKDYKGFPSTLCVSVNEVVVHGIPNNYVIKEGDIVSVDCGVVLNGYYGDSAYTFPMGNIDSKVVELLKATKESLNVGIAQCVEGKRIGDISFAIQDFCETKHPYSVVRELVGHGVGIHLHEEPEVPNYGTRGKGAKLKEGIVIAIEPMVNMGKKEVVQSDDGWTITTKDMLPSAHYEHTVAIRKNKPDVLTTFEFVEKAIKENKEIVVII